MLEKKAQEGDAEAQYQLGQLYTRGDGVELDFEASLKWFRESANQDYVPAFNSIGFAYEFGKGVEIDNSIAISWYEKAAKAADVFGLINLANFYKKGVSGILEKDLEVADKYYKKAFNKAKILVKKGDVRAQRVLGYCYVKGLGVEQNTEKSIKWLKKAARKRDCNAMSSLALYYDNGDGVKKNIKKAVKLYKAAAEHGSAEAQANFGICFEYGTGVKKDIHEAFKWYNKAAERMLARGLYFMGLCYEFGDGTAENPKAAYESYNDAAKRGNIKAQYRLAKCYETGKGVEKDLKKAAEWYEKLANSGEVRAKYYLGVFYEEGKGVEKNIEKAVILYKEAAEHGNVRAQTRLGEFYEKGIGVNKNIKEAKNWYSKAAAKDDWIAQFMLDKLEKEIKRNRAVSEEEQINVDYVFRLETIWAFERPIDDVEGYIKECEKYAETDGDILSQRRGAEKRIWIELLNKLQKNRAYLQNNRIGKSGEPLCTSIEEVEEYRDKLNDRIKKLICDVKVNIEKDIRTSTNPISISKKKEEVISNIEGYSLGGTYEKSFIDIKIA